MSFSKQIILVTGAARSGKSEWAETLAVKSDRPVTYIATALDNAQDLEWQRRIEQHRQRRPHNWQTLEVPIELASVIEQTQPSHCLLIDSLGTWVANCLEQNHPCWEISHKGLLNCLKQSQSQIILVAEETGWGVVPAYESGRLFRDRLGSLIQEIGKIADIVYLVTGGYVLNLSQLGQPLERGSEGRRG